MIDDHDHDHDHESNAADDLTPWLWVRRSQGVAVRGGVLPRKAEVPTSK
jgi:hypothetical protein